MTIPLPDAPGSAFTVDCVSTVAALQAVQHAWQRLADTASEPNVFLEPLFLLPALTHLTPAESVCCVLVWAPHRNSSEAKKAGFEGPVLCGLFPVLKGHGLGEKHGIWVHEYAYSGAPLVRSDCTGDVLEQFLDWLDSQQAHSFRWPQFPVHTVLYRELLQLIQQRKLPLYVQNNFLRAEFKPAGDTDSYLRRALSKSTRKELLRMERRLKDQGEVTTTALAANDNVQPWITNFLTLEASGWKGHQASALDSTPASKRFFGEMVHAAHVAGRLIMLELRVDDTPIAMNVGLRTDEGGFYFKIAHSPAYRRYMPGRILELGFIRWLHDHPDIQWFDSCAAPNHQMIERLWDGRRHMQSFWSGKDNRTGRLKIVLLALLSETKALIRRSSKKGSSDD